jgi:hypothetical protein
LGVNPLRLDAPSLAAPLPHDIQQLPADLALVIERWTNLPEAIRAGIVAMVRASLPSSGDERGTRKTRKTRKGGGR